MKQHFLLEIDTDDELDENMISTLGREIQELLVEGNQVHQLRADFGLVRVISVSITEDGAEVALSV